MHLVHLFQIAWFTVNTLYRSTYPRLAWITRCTSSTFSFQFFFFFSSNSLFHKDFYRAGCKTSAIWACKHWIFLFPGCGDESDGVEFKIDENKNLPKLRSCKTKPTRCIQNNERTLRKFVQQWGVCQPCSGVLVDEIVLHGRDPLFFFFLSGVGLRAILESHYSFVFTGSAHRLVKHSDIWSPESTKNVMNITL